MCKKKVSNNVLQNSMLMLSSVFEQQRPFQMVSHINNKVLNANEEFVNFLDSKLITCSIDDFILQIKSQSIAYLLGGSKHIHWVLELEGKVHSIWMLWTCGCQ